MQHKLSTVRVVIQAGGEGRRLLPNTDSTPKPLLKVAGVPMLERLLRQLVDSGFRRITVITGWLGDLVEQHLKSLQDLPDDLLINVLREPRPMGNVGALSMLPKQPEPILLVFGDLVTDLDFNELFARHQRMAPSVTLTSHYEEYQLHLGEIMVEEQRVTAYHEKPKKRFLICSGIAVFEPEVINLLDPESSAGISDLVSAALSNNMSVQHWLHGAFWMDVNSPHALAEAEKMLTAPIQPV